MKLALISDIHANQEALEAVLKDSETRGVERIHCLGDVIGYGSNPVECLNLVKAHCDVKLMGNHEYAALGLVPESHMNSLARRSMEWTRTRLTDCEIAMVSEFDMTAEIDGGLLVHASPFQPEQWHYVLSEIEARPAFRHFKSRLAFFGHTHLPLIFSLAPSDNLRIQAGHDIDLDDQDETRYLINIGSVGQPRDDDPRAFYVVYDTAEAAIRYHRVAYDISAAQAKMTDAHLPRQLIERLEAGRYVTAGMQKYTPYVLYLLIAILVAVLFVNDFGPMSGLQTTINDLLCRVTADSENRPNVVLVEIDKAAVEQYGAWPWNRDLIADLTAATAAGEPKAIMLDFELYEDAEQDSAGYTDVLASPLTWITQAVLPYDIALSTYRSSRTNNPEYLFNNSVVIENRLGMMEDQSSLLARKVFLPAEKLVRQKPLLGFDYNTPDDDRVLRRQPLLTFYEGYYYPSISLAAAATYLGVKPSDITVVEGKEVRLGNTRSIPIDRQGNFLIEFSQGTPYGRYGATKVLSEDFDRNVLKNKLVIITVPGDENNEYFDTPVEDRVSESIIKATVAANIINGDIIAERGDLTSVILLLLLGAGGLCALVLPRLNLTHRMLILGGGLVVLANANYLLFSFYSMFVPTAYLALELVLFMFASPFLDSVLLATREGASKAAAKIKAKPDKVKAKDALNTPVRELKSSPNDQDSVATSALASSDKVRPSTAEIDHQTISLDEPGNAGATAASRPEQESGGYEAPSFHEPQEFQESRALSDSDALFVTEERDHAPADDSQGILTDSDQFLAKHPDVRSLGRYQIEGILGKGAMGTVYRGVDPAINRPVALKTIRLDFVNDPEEMAELKERLHREAQAAGKLSHPNIVTIYDVGSEGSLQYIAMEYLEGRTLEEMIKKKTRFNYRIIAQMISQICAALDYAHSQGIVHRDIKPANIMVLGDYRVKVMDFGIARVDSNSMTKTGIAMGTPNYISPEQLQGKEIDRRADLFSLGVVMYEMLLGRRPFKGENLTSLIYSILHHDPEKPSSVRPQIPLLFDHIIGKALQKDPQQRYQKASDITNDLHDFVESFAH